MKRVKFEFNYYESYWVCLKCHAIPKIKRCLECKGPLQRVFDPYDNQHLLDMSSGFHCKVFEYGACQ